MEVARRYAAQAQAALDPLPPGSARRTLIRLADYAVTRDVPVAPNLEAALELDDSAFECRRQAPRL
jgi:hypothetical protein